LSAETPAHRFAAPRKFARADADPTPAREVETAAPKATASRKRISVAAQKSASKKHHAGKAKGTTGFNHFRSKSTTRASVRPAMRDCAMM
jgi:hypothetical protein